MRYIKEDTNVVFSEVPDEITLAINISNCPHRCKGCHSPYLQKDKGDELTYDVVADLINENEGISCVCFMGGDANKDELVALVTQVREKFPTLKTAVYSGDEKIYKPYYNIFDYIKIGPYIEEKGPLNSKTTNQKMFYLFNSRYWDERGLIDITKKFQKNSETDK